MTAIATPRASATSDRPQGPSTRVRLRRAGFLALVTIVALICLSAWFDRSDTTSVDLTGEGGVALTRVVVVNDAGPIRVSDVEEGQPATVTHHDSYLVRGPEVEIVAQGGEVLVRVRCRTRFPCRSRVDVVLPSGLDVVVLAPDHLVEVDRFDGDLTVYSGVDGATLGPLFGTARVITQGPVSGFELELTDLDLATSGGSVDLVFAATPDSVAVDGSSEAIFIEIPGTRTNIDVETTSGDVTIDARSGTRVDRIVVVRSEGPVTVVNPRRN